MLSIGAVAAALVVTAALIPLGFLAFAPGPTYAIDEFVVAPDVTPLNGESLMLTIVYSDTSLLEAARSLFDPAVDLVERERVRPAGMSDEEYAERNRQSMDQSKQTAIYVALSRLGEEVTIDGDGVSVEGIIEGAPAQGVLETGDVIVAIDGIRVHQHPEAVTIINDHAVGDELTLEVVRGVGTEAEETFEVTIVLAGHEEEGGRPIVGFLAGTHNWRFESPIEVEIDVSNVGGPSAGLMYTITLLDLLSPDDILAGRVVAGTGTINRFGDVGGIGGVRQKVIAAEREGADVMFVPEANWEEALTVGSDLELVMVTSVDDALAWLGADGLALAG